MFFKTYWLLWQNARNLNYIKEYNSSIAKKLADSKLKTKEFLKSKWIDVPDTLFILKKHEDLSLNIFDKLEPPFVVKPNGGFWGKWILIFVEKLASEVYVTNSWKSYTKKELINHFSDIIDWFYSLSWNKDKVVIEKKIELDEEIDLLWKYWLPDIRIITFNMVPVMAMLRLPTLESNWKANLHGWACWVGIDIWTWRLTYITSHWKIIKSVPWIWDIRWLKLPHWEKALALAVKTQQVTNIWYLGCDIVLDKIDWPLILEMNIRPGLEVQVANMSPLKARLERVEWIYVNTVEKWVRLWRDLFSWDIEDKIKSISWKKVLWNKEYLTIIYDNKKYKYLTEIKSTNTKSYIDKDFTINVLRLPEKQIELWNIRLDVNLMWEKRKMKFIIKELWSVNIILWLNSLRGFLIDPFKYKKWELPISDIEELKKWKNMAINKNNQEQFWNINDKLLLVDKKLLILKYFTPKNLISEKQKFIESNWEYVPQFEYNEIKIDLEKELEDIEKLEISDFPLSSILKRKQEEVINKIKLLIAFKNNHSKDITYYSKKIFWDINKENLLYSNDILSWKIDIKEEEDFLTFDEIKEFINKFNHIYWINIRLKRDNKSARFIMKWDTLIVRNWAKVWKKEMRSIIAHEIEGHYLRKYNWKKIKFSIFWHWTAWYLEIDEWIAIYNQSRFLSEKDRKYYSIFERYYFVNYALNNSYKKLVSKMIEYYNWDLEKVFVYLTRLKRWIRNISDEWIFVKDVVYVNWYLKVENYINSWWNLKELYLWKINLKDLEEIKDSYFLKINFSDIKLPFFL